MLYRLPAAITSRSTDQRVFITEQADDISVADLDESSRVTDFSDLAYERFSIGPSPALLLRNINSGNSRVVVLTRGVKVNVSGPGLSAADAKTVATAVAAG